ncbi:hypothetical protein [Roseovarius sp. SYSU LYC5161]|uniref:hypothetical protein n=1 Tax=Roseovarius halophilus (ex Wu et al. 2025) TaxID=3376060 RepID=UPI003999BDE7
MSDGLTQKAAAERLGVKQPYVAKLLKEGRLRRLPGSKKVDPVSVEEISESVGTRKKDSGSGGRAEPAQIGQPSEPDAAPEKDGADTTPAGLSPANWAELTYSEARRIKEANTAWLRHLEAQAKAGELVERAAVVAEWEEVAQHVRERLLGLPVRAATRLGLEPAQKDTLDALVREVLSEFAPDDSKH